MGRLHVRGLTDRCVELVLVDGVQHPFEWDEGGAPHRVLEVVTRAVKGAVLVVVTHVAAVGAPTVGLAPGETGDGRQVRGRHQLVVIDG